MGGLLLSQGRAASGGVQRALSPWVGSSQLGELCQPQERAPGVLMEPRAAGALAWEEGRAGPRGGWEPGTPVRLVAP